MDIRLRSQRLLLERSHSSVAPDEGDVVADFFCGGGTTAAVAQRLGRRWIACDQSRVAVAITADRLTRQVEEQIGQDRSRCRTSPSSTGACMRRGGWPRPRRISSAPSSCVLRRGARGARSRHSRLQGRDPVWVGEPDQKKAVTAADVQDVRQRHAQDAALQAGQPARRHHAGLGVPARRGGSGGAAAPPGANGPELHPAGHDPHRLAALPRARHSAFDRPCRLRELSDLRAAAESRGGLQAHRSARPTSST